MVGFLPPAEGLDGLFDNEKYSDVEVYYVEECDENGFETHNTYHGHKAMLSTKSAFFCQKLDSEPDASVIHIRGGDTESFEQYLKILYGYRLQSGEYTSCSDVQHIIAIHGLATTMYAARHVQIAACKAVKAMLSQQRKNPWFSEDEMRSYLEGYLSSHYQLCGPDMGRIICEFLVKEYPSLVKEESMKQMIMQYSGFARDAMLAIVEHGGAHLQLGGAEE